MVKPKSAKHAPVLLFAIVIVPLLTYCAAPTPQSVPVPETVVVRETSVVEQTSVVEVEVEVVVTATPEEKGIVEFASFWAANSPNGREMESLGYRLEAENPECDFVFTEYPGSDAYQTVRLRAQEGDPPSVYSGGASAQAPEGGDDWKSGLLYDLAPDMASPAYGETEGSWLDTFTPSAQAQIVFDGHVGAVPANEVVLALFYNKKLYAEHGLTPPRTWEELMANSEVLKQAGIASIGGGGFNGYVGYWYDNLLYRLLGNEAMYALYNGTDPAMSWTDPEPVLAAQMLVDMINNGYASDGFVGGDYAANQVAFFTGQVAHLYIGTFVMGEVADVIPPDFEFGVTYFPTVEGYEDKTPYEAVTGFVNTFGIFNPGANSEKNYSNECAVKYLKLYTDKDVQAGLVQSLDFISPVKEVPGPDSIPEVGEVMAGIQEWWPTSQAMYYSLPAELRTKMWDNIVLLASLEVTPEEFGALMETDYAQYR